MKTTIDIDDDLLAAVKERARSRGTSMREVVEDALRRLLTSGGEASGSYDLQLPVVHGRQPPSIDVDSNAAIDAHLDRRERP